MITEKKKVALVTGAAGFIGSHLTDLLLKEGLQVIGVDDLSTGRRENLSQASTSPDFMFLHKGVNDLSPQDFPENPDWIFHIAGRADLVPAIHDPEDYFHVNVQGTLHMLQLARQWEVERFLYTASSTCYGLPEIFPTPETSPCKPTHPYGLTKYLGEQLVMHWAEVYDVPALSLRLFNVYGPRSRTSGNYGAVFGVFLKQKLAEKPFTVVGDGTQTRDFTFVSDVADAFLTAARSSKSGEFYNIGSGNTYSVNHLVELLGGEVTYIPKRPGEPDCTFADISKIRSELNWNPKVSFSDGVSQMVNLIENWKDAPLWEPETIHKETEEWFKYLKPLEPVTGK